MRPCLHKKFNPNCGSCLLARVRVLRKQRDALKLDLELLISCCLDDDHAGRKDGQKCLSLGYAEEDLKAMRT
jgi:hypothetical protein